MTNHETDTTDPELVYDPHRYKRWLRGWLSYAFARYVLCPGSRVWTESPLHSEVFVIVSLTLFLPICLEQFAR